VVDKAREAEASPGAVDGRDQVDELRGNGAGGASARSGPASRGILVTGSPRSGTTWVGRMLATDPRLTYFHEPFNNRSRRVFHNLLGPMFESSLHSMPPGKEVPHVTRCIDYLFGVSDDLALADQSSWGPEERQLFRIFDRCRERSG